jgi:hypothetical protein
MAHVTPPGNPRPSEAGSGSGWHLSRRVFLCGLSGVYAVAFASMGFQVEGLLGSGGIGPAAEFLERAFEALGANAYWRVPTWLWFGCSDAALSALCVLGFAASAAAAFGFAPAAALFVAWSAYLSLVVVGDVFFAYQWDTLLLETGLLACLIAPTHLLPRKNTHSSVPIVPLWALRWLLFRLVFLSAVVKLNSGDPSWQDGTALQFHYFTQPLPGPLSWHAHQLPDALQRAATFGALAIEGLAPWGIFGPRRIRIAAAAAIAGLMLAIAATGNYGFFNPLTLCLCFLLLDDATLRRFIPARWRDRCATLSSPDPEAPSRRTPERRAAKLGAIFRSLLCCVLAGVATVRGFDSVARVDWPQPLRSTMQWLAPLRSANTYGLFAVMTTTRREIEVEGSQDGRHWRPLRFAWKPGATDRMPGFTRLHMPRLDWQMWFAALGNCRGNPWFADFARRLLEGSPAVVTLLDDHAFFEPPPRYLRSTLFDYRFAPPGSADWWQRSRLRAYCPIFTLSAGRLVELDPAGRIRVGPR